MGQRGKLRKSDEQRALMGGIAAMRQERKSIPRLFDAEPMTKAPPPPEWLPGPVAEKEWRKQAAAMVKAGMLYETDLTMLGMYCTTFNKITDAIADGKNIKPFQMTQFTTLAAALGFAPKWRERMDSVEQNRKAQRAGKQGSKASKEATSQAQPRKQGGGFARFRAGSP